MPNITNWNNMIANNYSTWLWRQILKYIDFLDSTANPDNLPTKEGENGHNIRQDNNMTSCVMGEFR